LLRSSDVPSNSSPHTCRHDPAIGTLPATGATDEPVDTGPGDTDDEVAVEPAELDDFAATPAEDEVEAED
jgi:hypothetical protein